MAVYRIQLSGVGKIGFSTKSSRSARKMVDRKEGTLKTIHHNIKTEKITSTIPLLGLYSRGSVDGKEGTKTIHRT